MFIFPMLYCFHLGKLRDSLKRNSSDHSQGTPFIYDKQNLKIQLMRIVDLLFLLLLNCEDIVPTPSYLCGGFCNIVFVNSLGGGERCESTYKR